MACYFSPAMKTSVDLFLLIRSLSKSEKRYFKLDAQRQKAKGGANYLKLFDAIEKQENYDEEKLKKQFAGSIFIKHLPSEKNYLYSLIVKSLVKYHASTSVEIELDELIHSAEILFKKGLYAQSNKILSKAMNSALENELFSRIFKISELQLNLIPHVSSLEEKMNSGYERSLASVRLALEKLENQNRYNELHSRLYRMIRKEGELVRTREELSRFEKIMNDPLMQNESLALSKTSRRLFYFIQSTYYHITGDAKQALYYELRELAEMESDKKLIAKDSLVYTARVSNLCETLLRMKNFDLCKKYLDKLKNAAAEFQLEKARLFYRYYDFSLRLFVQTGDFEKAVALTKTIEAGLEKYKENIHVSRQISIYYYLAYAHFGCGNFKNALYWINKVYEEKTDLRSDLLCYARLLNCIIHFELKNYLLLESTFKSAQYFFSKRKKMFRLETSFLKHFRKISNIPDSLSVHAIFKKFKIELDELLHDEHEKSALEYFDLLAWLDSKLNSTSFATSVQHRLLPA